jgi:hypothetical protein
MIQDASIDSAQIAEAAIETAHIGELAVDTLNIAGNAVLVPAFDDWESLSGTTSSTVYLDLATVSITVPETGDSGIDTNIPVLVNWGVEAGAENEGAGSRQFKVVRSGGSGALTVHETFSGGQNIDQYSGGAYQSTVNAGTPYTFTLQGKGASAMYYAYLSIMGMRR